MERLATSESAAVLYAHLKRLLAAGSQTELEITVESTPAGLKFHVDAETPAPGDDRAAADCLARVQLLAELLAEATGLSAAPWSVERSVEGALPQAEATALAEWGRALAERLKNPDALRAYLAACPVPHVTGTAPLPGVPAVTQQTRQRLE